MIDIIKNLRAFGKIHLESSDINPLVEMMRGIATEAADRIEREAADRIERLEAVVEAAKYVDAWERGNEHECYIDLRKALEELAR